MNSEKADPVTDMADVRVLGPETEHYWLVQRMARATGLDLVAAWEDGLIGPEDWAGIVTRCRGCQWADGCHRWLDQPVEGARATPDPCLNRDRLNALRDKLEGAGR